METLINITLSKKRRKNNKWRYNEGFINVKKFNLIIFNQRMIPCYELVTKISQSDIFHLPCNVDYSYDNNTLELLLLLLLISFIRVT